jgi:eukaryotic-like serine/threonine-protein kinase
MTKYITLSISAFILLLSVYSCSGISLNQKIKNSEGDWLEAGGSPKHQNVSSFILEPPLELKWSFDIDCGIGYSGIAVSDAVIFVNCLAGEMYTFDISGGGKLGKLTFLGKDANSTPLINGNNVIVSFSGDRDYSLASYNLETGLINWRINIGFLETSPVLYDGFIYIGSLDGNFYKVDIKTDSIMWKYNAKAQIHSTCAIDDNAAVFGADNGNIYCLNLADGSLKWKTSAAAPVVATPLINEGKVYVGSYDSCYYCLNLSDGSVIWEKNMGTKILGGSSLFKSNDIVFGCVNGMLYSLKAADGSENWRFLAQGVIGSSPLCSGYNIYFTSYDFNTYCIDGTKGTALWNYNLEGKSRTSPVIWKDYLVVAADKEVFCFSKNGAPK